MHQFYQVARPLAIMDHILYEIRQKRKKCDREKERLPFLSWIERVLERPAQIYEYQAVKQKVQIHKQIPQRPSKNNQKCKRSVVQDYGGGTHAHV